MNECMIAPGNHGNLKFVAGRITLKPPGNFDVILSKAKDLAAKGRILRRRRKDFSGSALRPTYPKIWGIATPVRATLRNGSSFS